MQQVSTDKIAEPFTIQNAEDCDSQSLTAKIEKVEKRIESSFVDATCHEGIYFYADEIE